MHLRELQSQLEKQLQVQTLFQKQQYQGSHFQQFPGFVNN
jgi:hypothetical protein